MSELIMYLQSHLLSITGIVGLVCAITIFAVGYYITWRRARQPIWEPDLGPLERGRRETIRRSGNFTKLEVTLGDSSYSDRLAAYVFDRSLGGLGILLKTPFIVGTVLRLRHSGSSDSSAWIEVEVRRCHRYKDAWLLGCQFIIDPTAEHLRLVG